MNYSQRIECPICYEVIRIHSDYSITKCKHKFHTSCIIKQTRQNTFNCPICRSKLATPTNSILGIGNNNQDSQGSGDSSSNSQSYIGSSDSSYRPDEESQDS